MWSMPGSYMDSQSPVETPELTNSFLAKRLPGAVLIAMALAVVVSVIAWETGDGTTEAPGGDYPAFYGAGRIVSDGDVIDLYSLDRQVAAQAGLFGDDDRGSAWYFAYPPQLAVAYGPLAALSYGWSYLVHTGIMAIALAGAIVLMRPMVPWLRGRGVLAMAAAMAFWPMFRAVTGGSNPALTGLLIVVVWRLVHDGRALVAGLVLSLLWYKPQIALPLLGLFVIVRHWRVVAGAVIGTVPFYALGVVLMGGDWVSAWYDIASSFNRLDAEINGHSAISWLGVFQNWLGVDSGVAVTVGWALAGLTALALAWIWHRGAPGTLDAKLALAIPGMLLLSPHAMSHEGAIVLITVAIVVQQASRARWMLIAIWLLGLSQVFILDIGFSPGFPLLSVILIWAAVTYQDRLFPLRDSEPSPA